MAEQRLLTGRSSQFVDPPVGELAFGRAAVVPAGGTLQLFSAGNTLVGKRMERAGRIVALTVQVNVVDGVQTYDLDIRVNGVSVVTLALPVATLGVQSVNLSVPFLAGDRITAFMVRTAGAVASVFNSINAQVEVSA